jgi:hypothetical protein
MQASRADAVSNRLRGQSALNQLRTRHDAVL